MKYNETYVRLNWPYLNELGISRPDNTEVLINPNACSFIKKEVSCIYSLSIIIFMVCHQEVNIFGAMELFNHFFDDNRANMFIFEMVVGNLFEANIITEVP